MNMKLTQRKSRWPMIIVGMLLVHISLMAAAVIISQRNRPMILPNYYQSALKWDQTQAQLRASKDLGWQVTLLPSPRTDPLGQREIVVKMIDRGGQPVSDAYIELTYFHHAYADQTLRCTMRTDAKGEARQVLSMRNEGWWQMHITASAAGERFVRTLTQYVSNGKGGPA